MVKVDIQQLTQEHFARIHRAALVLTGNPWDADDLAQETFLVLARQGHQFRGQSSWYTWLYGILLNIERMRRRRAGVGRQKLQLLWNEEASGDRSHPPASAPVEAAEWKRSLWGSVAQLSDGQRQALVLRFSEGLSYEEIATVMACPLGTVKSRLFHGLLALRQLMQLMQQAGYDPAQIPNYPGKDVAHVV